VKTRKYDKYYSCKYTGSKKYMKQFVFASVKELYAEWDTYGDESIDRSSENWGASVMWQCGKRNVRSWKPISSNG
jgi:hypothetical protein